jgi:hypothetical protein
MTSYNCNECSRPACLYNNEDDPATRKCYCLIHFNMCVLIPARNSSRSVQESVIDPQYLLAQSSSFMKTRKTAIVDLVMRMHEMSEQEFTKRSKLDRQTSDALNAVPCLKLDNDREDESYSRKRIVGFVTNISSLDPEQISALHNDDKDVSAVTLTGSGNRQQCSFCGSKNTIEKFIGRVDSSKNEIWGNKDIDSSQLISIKCLVCDRETDVSNSLWG